MAQGRKPSELKTALVASGAIRTDSVSAEAQNFITSGALKVETDSTKVRTKDDAGNVINERDVTFSYLAVVPTHQDAIPAALSLVGNSVERFAELINAEIKSEAALDSRGPDPVEKAAKDYISLMSQFGKTVTMAEALDAVRKMRESA